MGASLDEIGAVTGMARPSLYAAFGDKKALYRRCIDLYNRDFLAQLKGALFTDGGLSDDLERFYATAVAMYRSGAARPLGCATICTALNESPTDNDIRTDLTTALHQLDALLERRFERAFERSELRSGDPRSRGALAAAVLHSLAIRLRADQPGFVHETFIRSAVAMLVQP